MDAQRQLAAIMFTDIVGYTALMGKDEAKALKLLEENRELHEHFTQQHQGEYLKEMGDGVLLSFPSTIEAVRCAIDIQTRAFQGTLKHKIRIGIHVGDVTKDNKDIFGDGVNIASRLQAIAAPGGVVISGEVQHLIRSHTDFAMKPLGHLTLKNVSIPVSAYEIQGDAFPHTIINIRQKTFGKANWLAIVLFLVIAFAGIYYLVNAYYFVKSIRSVTVMPFNDLAENSESEGYWAEGMTNTLLSNLGKVSALKVIWNQTGGNAYEKNKPLAQIGEELGVDAIILGSVLREDNLVRITAQMIDPLTEELLWSGSYDREITSILKLHSEVALAIVEEIQILVTPDEISKLEQAPNVDPDAYESLLKGFYHLYQLNPDHYDSALVYFTEALSEGSVSAQANAAIALVWVHKGQWGGEAPLIAGQKAKKAALQAIRQQPDLPMANLAMAHVYTSYEWNWEEARLAFEKSISLNPNLSEPRIFYADLLVSLHEVEEAMAQIELATSVDPFSPFTRSIEGWVLFATGNFSIAIPAFEKSLGSGDNSLSHRCLWAIYHFGKKYKLAIKHAAAFYRSQGLDETAEDLETEFEQSGYVPALRYAATRLIARANRQYFSSMRVARLYAFTGDDELALDWLEKAYDEHYVSFFSLNVDPHWQQLHDQPRFLNLVNKMNLTLP